MAHATTQPGSTGLSFLIVVLSAIGTAAGLLIVVSSFFFNVRGTTDLADAGGFFENMRLMALALTALSATVFVVGLGNFFGRPWGRAMKLAAAVALAGAIVIAVMMITTVA